MDKISITYKKVKIKKIKAIRFGEDHPNGVNSNYEHEDVAQTDVVIGFPVCIGDFRSSIVTEIVNENTFMTKNSVYHIEILEDNMVIAKIWTVERLSDHKTFKLGDITNKGMIEEFIVGANTAQVRVWIEPGSGADSMFNLSELE
jgi:hypothetical protein